MLVFLLQLLFAHLLGDFLFQPDSWVMDKQEKKYKSKYLYWHMGIHALLLMAVLAFDFTYWLGMVIILVSHYCIDLLKLLLLPRWNGRWLFFIDQLAHLLVILVVTYFYFPLKIDFEGFLTYGILLLGISVLLCTVVTSVVVQVLISKWKPQEDESQTLDKAGAYIGMLERLFVFGFVVANFWGGIGFLLGAKSIFRFGDLSRTKDRNLTEYVLIGTLLSFGIAILIGIGYNHLSQVDWSEQLLSND